ncbi:MAG TPA: aminotransferase class V-fold PLP-dependent enzyme, partial [Reyranella sp.]
FKKLGWHCHFVDPLDPENFRRALTPKCKAIFVESLANPGGVVVDLAAIADIAHSVDAVLCVDSTVSTPIFTRPIAFGADIVVHSATKYLNGHSDVVAGVLATAERSDIWDRIRKVRTQIGATLGPFEAWLLMRGIRTLHVRVKAQSETAAALASRLVGHSALSAVLYPGLRTHAGHHIAIRQMIGGFGGMMSIRVKGGEPAAVAAAAQVRLWKRATSLGGVESLIEHRASIEGAGTPCPSDLLRLSVGLEDIDDLFLDLVQALGR